MELAAEVVGVWKLVSMTFEETATGAVSLPFGEQPTGHIIFTEGGHMMALGVGSGRTPLSGTDPTDIERAALFKSMFAYSGTYRLDGNKVVHEVTVSWNQAWTGTDQVRMGEIVGNRLAIKSAPFMSPQTGREVVGAALWERLE